MSFMRTVPNSIVVAVSATALLSLTACGSTQPSKPASSSTASSAQATAAPERTETAALHPRITFAHDGGVTVIDSMNGETLATEKIDGYVRLSPAGDGRHVMATEGDGFRIIDTGLITQAHGDHAHFYHQKPQLTEHRVPAPHPGHVVPHEGRTAIYADGTGEVTMMDPSALKDGKLELTSGVKADSPHHGVAVPLANGELLMTQGTEDKRNTVQVKDKNGKVIAETTDCPGVHGEAVAEPTEKGSVAVLGCENGPVIYRDGAFHKVQPLQGAERSGNLRGDEKSSIVLADGEPVAADGDGSEKSQTIGLIDTRTGTQKRVDLDSPYWFRSLDRGLNGEAVVLTEDGDLTVIDPASGKILHEVPVAKPWTEPEDWQQAAPMVQAADGLAYVSDPATKKLTVVDIAKGEVVRTLDLPVAPHEMQVTTGE